MALLVPTRGFFGGRFIAGGAEDFLSLGPVAVGWFIDWVEVSVCLRGEAGGQVFDVAGAIGPSGAPDAGSIIAGTSIIDSSDLLLGTEIHSIQMAAIQSVYYRFRFPVGRLVDSAPLFLVCEGSNGGTVSANFQVAMRCLRFIGRRVGEDVGVGAVL